MDHGPSVFAIIRTYFVYNSHWFVFCIWDVGYWCVLEIKIHFYIISRKSIRPYRKWHVRMVFDFICATMFVKWIHWDLSLFVADIFQSIVQHSTLICRAQRGFYFTYWVWNAEDKKIFIQFLFKLNVWLKDESFNFESFRMTQLLKMFNIFKSLIIWCRQMEIILPIKIFWTIIIGYR